MLVQCSLSSPHDLIKFYLSFIFIFFLLYVLVAGEFCNHLVNPQKLFSIINLTKISCKAESHSGSSIYPCYDKWSIPERTASETTTQGPRGRPKNDKTSKGKLKIWQSNGFSVLTLSKMCRYLNIFKRKSGRKWYWKTNLEAWNFRNGIKVPVAEIFWVWKWKTVAESGEHETGIVE